MDNSVRVLFLVIQIGCGIVLSFTGYFILAIRNNIKSGTQIHEILIMLLISNALPLVNVYQIVKKIVRKEWSGSFSMTIAGKIVFGIYIGVTIIILLLWLQVTE